MLISVNVLWVTWGRVTEQKNLALSQAVLVEGLVCGGIDFTPWGCSGSFLDAILCNYRTVSGCNVCVYPCTPAPRILGQQDVKTQEMLR